MTRGFSAFVGDKGWARALRAAALVAMALALFGGLAPAIGCSSSSTQTAPPACDSTKCKSGNQCIDDGSGSGPTCHEVCTAQTTCPFGWYCNDGVVAGQPANWCVQGTTPLAEGQGQWGMPCSPSEGETNPACDTADGFYCYGLSPTDATAFCTIFQCGQDSDCPGGWWCETVDVEPSVKTVSRSFGWTQSVCKRRDYCAPCRMDHDCPAAAGTQQHCVQAPGASVDEAGAPTGYCTPQCASNGDCPLDATCVTQWPVCAPAQGPSCASDDDCPPADGTYQHCDAGACTPECGSDSDCTGTKQTCTPLSTCQPRAGTCLGAGAFCSPCRSDADCTEGGYCLYADYSTERYCSVAVARGTCPPATTAGVVIDAALPGQCPAAPKGSSAAVAGKGAVGCTFSSTSFAQPNQCIALTTLSDGNGGETSVVGCWTVNR